MLRSSYKGAAKAFVFLVLTLAIGFSGSLRAEGWDVIRMFSSKPTGKYWCDNIAS